MRRLRPPGARTGATPGQLCDVGAEAGPVLNGYGGQGGETQGSLGGAQGGVASLPFTGTELTLVLLFGVALLISGLALRRFSGARP